MIFHKRLKEISNFIKEEEGKEKLLKSQLSSKKKELKEAEQYYKDLVTARWLLTEAVSLCQKKFQLFVETLMTKAIQSVYDNDLKCVLNIEKKANKTIIQPLIQENDHEPMIPREEDLGVGILDLMSAAFRFIFKRIETPKTRDFIWLDEPMRDIGKGKLLNRAADFLKEISRKWDIQLIITTHEPELTRIADRIFYVEHNGTYSVVNREGYSTRPVIKKRKPLF